MVGTAAQKGAMIGLWRNDTVVTESSLSPGALLPARRRRRSRAVAQCAISLDFYAADIISEA
jgi:hypothetical protein